MDKNELFVDKLLMLLEDYEINLGELNDETFELCLNKAALTVYSYAKVNPVVQKTPEFRITAKFISDVRTKRDLVKEEYYFGHSLKFIKYRLPSSPGYCYVQKNEFFKPTYLGKFEKARYDFEGQFSTLDFDIDMNEWLNKIGLKIRKGNDLVLIKDRRIDGYSDKGVYTEDEFTLAYSEIRCFIFLLLKAPCYFKKVDGEVFIGNSGFFIQPFDKNKSEAQTLIDNLLV